MLQGFTQEKTKARYLRQGMRVLELRCHPSSASVVAQLCLATELPCARHATSYLLPTPSAALALRLSLLHSCPAPRAFNQLHIFASPVQHRRLLPDFCTCFSLSFSVGSFLMFAQQQAEASNLNLLPGHPWQGLESLNATSRAKWSRLSPKPLRLQHNSSKLPLTSMPSSPAASLRHSCGRCGTLRAGR